MRAGSIVVVNPNFKNFPDMLLRNHEIQAFSAGTANQPFAKSVRLMVIDKVFSLLSDREPEATNQDRRSRCCHGRE